MEQEIRQDQLDTLWLCVCVCVCLSVVIGAPTCLHISLDFHVGKYREFFVASSNQSHVLLLPQSHNCIVILDANTFELARVHCFQRPTLRSILQFLLIFCDLPQQNFPMN